jgi:hypothetical protein
MRFRWQPLVRRGQDVREIARLPGPDQPPEWVHLKFSPDSRRLVVGYTFSGRAAEFHVWDLSNGTPRTKMPLPQALAAFDIVPARRRNEPSRRRGIRGNPCNEDRLR